MLHARFWAIAAICLTIASPASAQLYDRGTARDGALLSERASPSATACRAACALDNSCAAWTWERAGEQGPEAMCRLQAEAVTARPDNCCISGVSPASSPDGVRQTAALEVGAVEARNTAGRGNDGAGGGMQRPSRDYAPFTRKLTRYSPPAEMDEAEMNVAENTAEVKPRIDTTEITPVKKTAMPAPASENQKPSVRAQSETEAGTAIATAVPVRATQNLPQSATAPAEPAAPGTKGPVLLAASLPAPPVPDSRPAAAFMAAPSRPEPVRTAISQAPDRPVAPEAEMIAAPEPAAPDAAERVTTKDRAADERPAPDPAPSAVARAAMTSAPAAGAAPVSAPEPAGMPALLGGARLLPDAVRPEPDPMISTAGKRRAGRIVLGETVALNFDPTAEDDGASDKTGDNDEEGEPSAQKAGKDDGQDESGSSEEGGEAAALAESGAPEAQGAGRKGYVHPSQRSAHPRYSVQHEYAAPYPDRTASN